MKNLFFMIAISTYLNIYAPITLAAQPSNQEGFETLNYKAAIESKIESLKESNANQKALLEQEITSQNKLIEQLNHQVDWLGHIISFASALITILLVGIGIVSYRNARSDAQNIAKRVAEDVTKGLVDKWFIDNSDKITSQINSLEKQLNEKIEKTADLEKKLFSASDSLFEKINSFIGNPYAESELSTFEVQTLKARIAEIERKNTHFYNFHDWNTKAYDAFQNKNYELAIEFWDYASKVPNANDFQIAQSTFNKALSQGVYLKDYKSAVNSYDSLIQTFINSIDVEVQELVTKSFVNKGLTLGDYLNNHQAAIATYDALIQKFSTSNNSNLLESVAIALCNKANTLSTSTPLESIQIYDLIINKFINQEHHGIQQQLAKAYFNKAILQADVLNDRIAEINTYDTLIEQFKNSSDANTLEFVASAYANKGYAQDALGLQNEAIASYDQLINKFNDSNTLSLQKEVARALFNKAVSQGINNNAIQTYDALINKFKNFEDEAIEIVVAKSMLNKGVIQGELLNNLDEEVSIYNELINKFLHSKNVEIKEQVARARFMKGCNLLVKLHTEQTDQYIANENFRQALQIFEAALVDINTNQKGELLGCIAYVSHLLSHNNIDVFSTLHAAFEVGAKSVLNFLMDNKGMPFIREDDTFKTIVYQAWHEFING